MINKKDIIPPITISRKIFFNSRLAAAARGPGVGGISTCGAYNPVERATVSETKGVLVFSDRDLFNEFKITNAESQKTGIDTI